MSIKSRKEDHINICLKKNVEWGQTGFEDIFFVHNSLPELNYDDVDITTSFLGKKLDAPILIEALTGGTEKAKKINKNLAWAAQQSGIAMGIGSQRAALDDKALEETYKVRDVAPDIFLIGNIGMAQLKKYDTDKIKSLIDMIDADVLAIHLNPLQELVQKEGDKDFSSILEKIRELSKSITIIAKETGAGISRETASRLEKAGVSAIDVAGRGGTSWSLVEYYRGGIHGKTFENWGIPTAVSLIECLNYVKLPIISSGGLRSGIDVAKSLALGASLAGLALPFLQPAIKTKEHVLEKIKKIEEELKISMALVGSSNIVSLKQRPLIITGRTRQWLELRGIDVKKYAHR